jgi:MIP family channel proteins
MKVWQKYLAELFGTYVLVFIGSMSIVAASRLGPGIVELIAPFGFGLALLGALYAFAEVSGGHFNPAVSLGLFLDRRMSVEDLVGYWISQFVGAILASLTVLLAFKKSDVAGTATVPSSTGTALVIEIAMTAIFVTVILQSSKSSRYAGSALIAIPLTLLAIHFAAIPFSGSSVNPARTLGPALVGHHWKSEWIYFVGPGAGALIAAIVYTVVVKGDLSLKGQPATPAAQ